MSEETEDKTVFIEQEKVEQPEAAEPEKDLKELILEMPRAIFSQELLLIHLQGEIEKTKTVYNAKENELMVKVTSEINADTSKPRFPNEKSREAEISQRMHNDEDARKIKKVLMQLTDEMAQEKARLSMLSNKFSALKTIARLVTQDD